MVLRLVALISHASRSAAFIAVGVLRAESAAQLRSLLLLSQLALTLGLDLHVVDGQVYYLISEAGLLGGIGRRREIACPLEPQEVLMLFMVCTLCPVG